MDEKRYPMKQQPQESEVAVLIPDKEGFISKKDQKRQSSTLNINKSCIWQEYVTIIKHVKYIKQKQKELNRV